MIKSRRARPVLIMILIFTAVLGCNLPNSNGEDIGVATNTLAPESPAEGTVSPDATPTPTVVHTDFPGEPAGVRSFVNDRSTQPLAAEKRANADNFAIGLLERPYTSETMDYIDYMDITRGELSLNEPWLYVTIYLEGSPPDDAQAYYGLEVDNDIDGRGDWLIYGLVPASTDWTTDGVHVYRDSNNDVGGSFPVNSEAPNANRDGYDDEVFNQGQGADPDAAWIRRDPNDPTHIQLALKFSLLADNEFLWNVWADLGVAEPAYFDYNDHFTLEEAGSPVLNSEDYPVKALHSVDNSCRWGFNFEPNGSEPGACPVPPTPTPIPPTNTPIPPGSLTGRICLVQFTSEICNSTFGWSGITVTLGKGACNSSGAGSTTTGSQGRYNFSNLSPGTYCVTSLAPTSCPLQPNTPTKRTVIVVSGDSTTVQNIIYGSRLC